MTDTAIKQRPTPATVFGVLNLFFAGLGFVGTVGSLLLLAALNADIKNPLMQIIQNNSTAAAYLRVSAGQELVVSLVLLVAGIGLLLAKSWARGLSIAYGIFSIVSVPIKTVLSYVLITRPMMLELAQQEQNDPAAAGAVWGGLIVGVTEGCAGMLYPILLLVFMLRAKGLAVSKPTTKRAETSPAK